MAMNREQRRILQRRGNIDEEGNVVARKREAPTGPKAERSTPLEYAKGVRSEMKKVSWPKRKETTRYTIVVVITFVFVTAFVALLDFLFASGLLEVLN